MLVKTKGIVFRQVRFADYKRIVTVYTEQKGVVPVILRSNTGKRKTGNTFSPLTTLEMVIDFKDKREIQYVNEFSFSPPHMSIPFDPVKSAIALFLNEILYNTIQEEEKNSGLFFYIYNSICLLDSYDNVHPLFHASFLIELTKFLGFFPANNYSQTENIFDLREGKFVNKAVHKEIIPINETEYFSNMIKVGIQNHHKFNIAKPVRMNLLKNICLYFQLHVEGFRKLKSLEVLEQVMS